MTINHRMSTRVLFAIATLLGVPAGAAAQGDGPRMYWKTLSGSSAVTFWGINAGGNINPLDPAQVVEPTASFSADIAMLGYHRTLDLFDRAATASVLMPVGNLQGEVAGTPFPQQASASGFGDLTLQLNTNIIGGPAINDLPQLLRYEPTFTLDLLTSLVLPVGEYDGDETLNLGQNRWHGRIGAPMMLTFGPWVPGERTTLEVLPAVWLFDDNDDYQGGKTLSTDPIFAIEGHLTRDFTESAWGSLDVAWFSGGESQVAGVSGESIDNLGVGLTFGFQVNDNLSITMSYFSTIDDGDAGDVRGDEFRLMFSYGWNDLLEGMRRLSGE